MSAGLVRPSEVVEVQEELSTDMVAFLRSSIKKGTACGYKSQCKYWASFLEGQGKDYGYCLENVGSTKGKAIVLVRFIMEIYQKGKRAEQVGSILSALRKEFECRGLDLNCFSHPLVSTARSAAGRTTEEVREVVATRGLTAKLPMSSDMVWSMRDRWWTGRGWSTAADFNDRAIWLCVGLGFDSGPRVSNLTLRDGRSGEDHCLRAGEMSFRVRDPQSGVTLDLAGGQDIREFLRRTDVGLNSVIQVLFAFVTTKTTGRGKVITPASKVIARTSALEGQFLEDLCEWMCHSGVLYTDEVFTRYLTVSAGRGLVIESSRKVLVRKDVNVALKECARSFGFPAENFSSKSLRGGASTHARRGGESYEQICRRGGWAQGSVVPANHYIRDACEGTWSTVTADPSTDQFTKRDVENLLPATRSITAQRGARGGKP